jgi:hypothetical protein
LPGEREKSGRQELVEYGDGVLNVAGNEILNDSKALCCKTFPVIQRQKWPRKIVTFFAIFTHKTTFWKKMKKFT